MNSNGLFKSIWMRATLSRRLLTTSSSQYEAFLQKTSAEGISSLCLNRPQTKNAISVRLLEDLGKCLERVQEDSSTRVLIVHSSSPNAFCTGADLVERRAMTHLQTTKFLSDLRGVLRVLENLPLPTIAAIDGPALGGGLELALACDLRVADQTVTKIGLPEVRLGIIPGAGGTQRATRLLGVAKAKELIFTARLLDAEEAKGLGLVDHLSKGGAFEHALALAREISAGAPLALRAAKMAISRASELAIESGLDFEYACYQPLLSSSDRFEALNAFKEKRQPLFKGE